jgi:hypothetical protein
MRSQLLRGFSFASRALSSAAVPKAAFLPAAEVQARVLSVLGSLRAVDEARLGGGAHLFQDLRLDSLQRERALELLSREFCVELPASLLSVPEIVRHLSQHPRAK